MDTFAAASSANTSNVIDFSLHNIHALILIECVTLAQHSALCVLFPLSLI